MNHVMSDEDLDRLLDTWEAPGPSPALRSALSLSFPRPQPRRLLGMRLKWLLATAACVLAITGVGASLLHEPVISRGWNQLADGTYVRTSCMVEPSYAILKWFTLGGGSSSRSDTTGVWNRDCYHTDRLSGTYFGYSVRVEAVQDDAYLVTIGPLTRSLSEMSRFEVSGYHQVPLPGIPPARVVHLGEAFDVNVRVSNGERIYDRIEFSREPFPDDPARAAHSSGARPPAPFTIRLKQPQLYVNGQLLAAMAGAAAGPTVWLYVPDRGRYLMALATGGNQNFVQAGHANGRTIEFRDGNDEFRLVSTEDVTGKPGDQPVFVFHQSDFKLNPQFPQAHSPQFGSAGVPAFHH